MNLKHPDYNERSDARPNGSDDPNKLDLRNEIQEEYSSNRVAWPVWTFNFLDLPEGSRILELGSGTGALWQENAPRVPKSWRILLSDRSFPMIEKAQSSLSASRQGMRFLNIDGQALPFRSESFDAVLAVGLLDLVPYLRRVLREAWRVLRPGGQFIATAGGKGHLQELENLLRPFLPANMVTRLGGDENRFGMENGEKLLSTFFQDVARHEYTDRLVFTELEPVMDYVLSEQEIAWSMPLSKLGDFVQSIKRSLDEAGEFPVSVHKGLFVARKREK